MVPHSQPNNNGSQNFEACQCATLSAKGKKVLLVEDVSAEMGCTGPQNIRVEATASSPGAAQKRKNILARNQAAKEGFNVVVPTSRIFRKGRVQIFEAHQCDKLKKTGKDGQ